MDDHLRQLFDCQQFQQQPAARINDAENPCRSILEGDAPALVSAAGEACLPSFSQEGTYHD